MEENGRSYRDCGTFMWRIHRRENPRLRHGITVCAGGTMKWPDSKTKERND